MFGLVAEMRGVNHSENCKNCENSEIGLCLWPGCGVCTPNENGKNGVMVKIVKMLRTCGWGKACV